MALPTVSRCDSQTLRALVLSAGLIVSAGAAAQQGHRRHLQHAVDGQDPGRRTVEFEQCQCLLHAVLVS